MTELENTFSWSKSRDGTFRDCKRKYFYNYYGSWGGWKTTADRHTRQVYILKNLQMRYMWLGSLVHEYIEILLNKTRNGEDVNLYGLCANLKKAMNRDFENSESGLYKTYPKIYGRQYGLIEHEYNLFVSNDTWKQIFANAEKCVTNFFNSDLFKYIQSVESSNWLPIERLQTFDFAGTQVYVKIDFALEDDGKLLIFDWKTGKVRYVEMDIQLACYGLYSQEKWQVAPDDILCKKYNVLTNQVDDYEITVEVIAKVKEYMRDSIRLMKEVLHDKENNIAREEDFDLTTNDYSCKVCNFKKICPKFN